MKPDKIITQILADANAEADRILAAAKEKASETLKRATAEAQSKKDAVLAQGAIEAEQAGARVVAAAQMEGGKRVLSCKQAKISEAFDKATEKVAAMDDEAYKNLLTKMIIDMADGDEEIVLSARDKKRMPEDFAYFINRQISKDNVTATMRIAEETADISCGFLLKKGNVYVNCAFEDVARAAKEDLESVLVKTLFA